MDSNDAEVTLPRVGRRQMLRGAATVATVGAAGLFAENMLATPAEAGTNAPSPLNVYDISQYGAVPGNASANNAAFASIISAWKASSTAEYPIYIPPGTWQISNPVDLRDMTGVQIFGAGLDASILQQTSSNVQCLQIGANTGSGFGQQVSDLTLQCPTQSNTTNSTSICLELNASNFASIARVKCLLGTYGIASSASMTNGIFSCNFTDISIANQTASYISSTSPGSTGSVWSNIYCTGDQGEQINPVAPVVITNCSEESFRQLNIETITVSNSESLIHITDCGTISMESVHFESISAKTTSGGSAITFAFFTVDGGIGGGATLIARGVSLVNLSLTAYSASIPIKFYVFQSVNDATGSGSTGTGPVNIDACGLTSVWAGSNNVSSTGVTGYVATYQLTNPFAAISVTDISNLHESGTSPPLDYPSYLKPTDITTFSTSQQLSRIGNNVYGSNARPVWQTLTPNSPWASSGSPYRPSLSYSVDSSGWVRLSGRVSGGTVSSVVATLPAGFRPAYYESFATNANSLYAMVTVRGDGTIRLSATNQSGTISNLDLDGISFPAEQ